MQTQAPEGQYRVIGLDPVDTLTWPSGPLWKDCETFDEARDLADRNEESYAWVYVYDDAGKLLYEGGCHAQQLERIQKLNQESPGENKTQR
jgi:hypothetical protein